MGTTHFELHSKEEFWAKEQYNMLGTILLSLLRIKCGVET